MRIPEKIFLSEFTDQKLNRKMLEREKKSVVLQNIKRLVNCLISSLKFIKVTEPKAIKSILLKISLHYKFHVLWTLPVL